MEEYYSCSCCLVRPPDKGLKTLYNHLGKAEIYYDMLRECFGLNLSLGNDECGICEVCVVRLRDANDFKLQVQRVQDVLHKRLTGALPAKQQSSGPERAWNPVRGNTTESRAGGVLEESRTELDQLKKLVDDVITDSTRNEQWVRRSNIQINGLPEVKAADDNFKIKLEKPTGYDVISRGIKQESPGAEMADSSIVSVSLHEGSPAPFAQPVPTASHIVSVAPAPNVITRSNETGKKPYACNICEKRFGQKGHLNAHYANHTGKFKFSCELCKRGFVHKHQYMTHMRIHTGEKPYACNICDKRFRQKSHFNDHYAYHKGKFKFSCELCKKGFVKKFDYNSHMRLHTGEKPYECDKCDKKYRYKGQLKKHKNTHLKYDQNRIEPGEITACKKESSEESEDQGPAKYFTCDICKKQFVDKHYLDAHSKHHSGDYQFTCDICQRKFNTQFALNTHKVDHAGGRPFKCEKCNKGYTTKGALTLHFKVHTEDYKHACHLCSKRFIIKENLNVHMRLHTGEKPYTCVTCETKFRYRRNLKKHLLEKHNQVMDKQFSCDTCGKRFALQGTLVKHMNTHTEKEMADKNKGLAFMCEICSKRFSTKGILKTHRETHNEEKPFECEVCHKKYRTKTNLLDHMQVHEEKKHSCEVCGQPFRHKSALNVHIRRMHSENKPHVCDICKKAFVVLAELKIHNRVHTGQKPYACEICCKKFQRPGRVMKHLINVHHEEPTRFVKLKELNKYD